jgi:dihydrofolate reductase
VIRLIAAVDSQLGIANDHGIPWQGKLPKDTARFHALTSKGLIVMGYQTYKEYDKPLHDRENFVVTRPDTEELRPSFTAVLELAPFLEQHKNSDVWVIGGAGLFADSISMSEGLAITRLDEDFQCTKFFPHFDDSFELVEELGAYVENGLSFRFENWLRPQSKQG